MSQLVTDRLSDKLHEFLELLFATKNPADGGGLCKVQDRQGELHKYNLQCNRWCDMGGMCPPREDPREKDFK